MKRQNVEFEDVPSVKEAHRSFLMTRDLTTIAITFSVIGAIGLYIADTPKSSVLFYFMTMTIQYIVFMLIPRNHGKSFVSNVLAEYTARC